MAHLKPSCMQRAWDLPLRPRVGLNSPPETVLVPAPHYASEPKLDLLTSLDGKTRAQSLASFFQCLEMHGYSHKPNSIRKKIKTMRAGDPRCFWPLESGSDMLFGGATPTAYVGRQC